MKSYTDIEQSKKLAEILPVETADMCYPKDAFEYNYAKEPVCHYSGWKCRFIIFYGAMER